MEMIHSSKLSLSVLDNVGRVVVRSGIVVIRITALSLADRVVLLLLFTELTGFNGDLICGS